MSEAPQETTVQAPSPPKPPPKSAGWTRGVSRQSALYTSVEFRDATRQIAKKQNISAGIVVERALLAYFEAQPNGAGVDSLVTVAEMRQHCEENRD